MERKKATRCKTWGVKGQASGNISPLGIFIQSSTFVIGKHVCFQVAVLDVDVCGPSIPLLMGLDGEQVHQSGSGWSPIVGFLVLLVV